MSIILNGNDFPNGGTAKLGSTSLKEIKFGSTTVWKAELSLTGGSVSWNNTSTSQTATYCTWTDLGGFSSLSIPFSGYMNSANISGDSWSITIRLLFADNSTMTLRTFTSVFNGSTTFTADISGKSDTQLATVKVQAVGYYSYSVATNRYTYNSTTIGTSIAS